MLPCSKKNIYKYILYPYMYTTYRVTNAAQTLVDRGQHHLTIDGLIIHKEHRGRMTERRSDMARNHERCVCVWGGGGGGDRARGWEKEGPFTRHYGRLIPQPRPPIVSDVGQNHVAALSGLNQDHTTEP